MDVTIQLFGVTQRHKLGLSIPGRTCILGCAHFLCALSVICFSEIILLGFTKKERSRKELLAAFDLILIGRKDDRVEILKSVEKSLPAMTEKVTNGANTYEVAAKVVLDYILATLQKCSAEERVDLLKRIADNNFKKQPHIFELISHVNYCLIILEDEKKPLIPVGSAEYFVTAVSRWFDSSGKLVRRVIAYFEESTQLHRYHLQQNRRRNERKFR